MTKDHNFARVLALLAGLFATAWTYGAANLDSLLHMLDYVGVDYPQTVQNRQVTDPAEYAEQQEFSDQIQSLVRELPPAPAKESLQGKAKDLAALIREKAEGEKVSALASEMRLALMDAYQVSAAPRRLPDLTAAAALYRNHCAVCHGMEGRGDGPQAANLQPPPNNFHDTERQYQRSLYGLYNTITMGVDGTGMQGFTQLSEEERWALAFLVGSFPFTENQRAQGAELWRARGADRKDWDLKSLTTLTPNQIAARFGEEGLNTLAYLRSQPTALAATGETPLQFSARKLEESLARYRAGDGKAAYELAISAYLEGFELAEASLSAVDSGLRSRVEKEMADFRTLIQRQAPVQTVAKQGQRLQGLLAEAGERLNNGSLSPTMSFVSAFVILLREGLEAILVLAAIAAFLVKTERRDSLPYLHAGWVSALALGVATWAVAAYVIDISGASRELTEGVTALLAAVILFYVGFWLHNKTHAKRWKQFIESKVRGALSGRTLWALAAVSFIAVYREVFETVLFYQALWMQSGPSSQHLVVAGFVVAAVMLVGLSWLIFRFSVRLPLRLFFGANSVLLYLLAIVFAGNGVAALQEAGKLPIDPVDFPRVDLLGIHPNLQALCLQAALLSFAIVWAIYSHRSASRVQTKAKV